MSQLQRPPHAGPSNQCLTGCLYQVIQTTGLQGSNVLKLLPILKPKDSLLPVVPSPLTPTVPTLNVPQAVLSSPPPVPPPVSILSRPSPVSVPLVQTPALGNYRIAAQNNVTNSFHVENPFSLSETKLFVDNTQLTVPVNSMPANPTISMMNKKAVSPIKPTAMLPAGHSLQIPAHAEVISLPVSSLPYSIQQKILPQVSGPDTGKNPSVIYVSPVNTVKSNNNQSCLVYPSPNTSSIISKSLPSSTSEAQKGPMKWVVQESKESAACLVPVKSSNDTASKILQILSKTKMEEVNLTQSDRPKVVQIKENALVMCNNKIFFLTKKGTELIDAGSKNVEPPQYSSPEKPAAQIEPMKDLSNKVVQVVLTKNKLPPPSAEESVQSNVVSTAKPKRKSSTPRPARADPNDVYMPEDEGCGNVSEKTRDPPATLSDAAKSDEKKNDQLLPKSQGKEIPTAAEAPEVNGMDDGGWRLKFGLLKQEKIILKRIPLIRARGRSDVVSDVDPAETQQNQSKRKSSSEQDGKSSKKQKSKEDGDPNRNAINPEASADSPYSPLAGRSTAPGGGRLDTTQRSSASSWPPTYYGGEESDPPDSADSQVHQDITGHYSGVSLPSQRFHTDSFSSSMYPDETTKDEKIQRLKEVLKEREKALEVLRQKKMT